MFTAILTIILIVGGAGQRPGDIFGGEWRSIMPGHAFADGHHDLGLVVVPAPVGQQTGCRRKVWLLQDELVEHRLVDPLDCRVDRRRADCRIP